VPAVRRYQRGTVPVVRLSAQQASHLLAEGEIDCVDVCEPHEWVRGHVPGARHVPLRIFLRDPRGHLRQDKVLFVCAQGVRSLTAAAAAANHGCREVYYLEGGTIDWARLGFPMERE
jgi:rhodanese-related sulfurtransferase